VFFSRFFFGKFVTCHFYVGGIVGQTPISKHVIPLLVGSLLSVFQHNYLVSLCFESPFLNLPCRVTWDPFNVTFSFMNMVCSFSLIKKTFAVPHT
jgi:hypothetical protein